jgi:hypothetical protein
MTAVQLNAMNTQLWQKIGAIADNEPLMKRLYKYVSRLVKEKEDSTLMTKEEFFAKIEKGEEDYRQGRCTRLLPGESVTEMLRRSGFDV